MTFILIFVTQSVLSREIVVYQAKWSPSYDCVHAIYIYARARPRARSLKARSFAR